MEQSLDRLKGFSDAFIAIIITLMVLEIPLPQGMNQIELWSFAKALLIYVASFFIVAEQWNRHQRLFKDIETVSNQCMTGAMMTSANVYVRSSDAIRIFPSNTGKKPLANSRIAVNVPHFFSAKGVDIGSSWVAICTTRDNINSANSFWYQFSIQEASREKANNTD